MYNNVSITTIDGDHAQYMYIYNGTDTHNETYHQTKSKFQFFIFQIGFMKAGTTSLHDFFQRNGIAAIQFKKPGTRLHYPPLSMQMFSNYMNDTLVLEPYHNEFMYYGDFDVYAHGDDYLMDILFLNKSYKFGAYRTWFQILTKQYPNSKYILNIRNVNHWLKSRYTYSWRPRNGFPSDRIREYLPDLYQNDTQIVKGWKLLWYQYICHLFQYFNQHNIIDDLLVFDIENDNITKLVSFFMKHNLSLNTNTSMFLGHSRKTKVENFKNGNRQFQHRQFQKWDDIEMNNPEFKSNHSEYQQIEKQCKFTFQQ